MIHDAFVLRLFGNLALIVIEMIAILIETITIVMLVMILILSRDSVSYW